ncbi:hypothetical protein [uncultured Fibrella sp.]|uniref:hypothetical protein n=1 Tax=uncultured Fibrella sp. TaxID=1284596 RepID=UPI0035CC68ED
MRSISLLIAFLGVQLAPAQTKPTPKIDRKALVSRHTVINTRFDTLGSVSVGNGEFAFTVDATGLQTFPDYYKDAVPLGTQSQWGWHAVPNPGDYKLSEVYNSIDQHGRKVPYTFSIKGAGRQEAVSNYFRENPHRLHLGMIGFALKKADGSTVKMADLRNIRQTLAMWKGEIRSHFEVDNQPVDVVTICHPVQDMVAVQVRSPLVTTGRLQVTLRFPYGASTWEGFPDFDKPTRHTTRLRSTGANAVVLERQLDTTRYTTALAWTGKASVREVRAHEFVLTPHQSGTTFDFTCRFTSGAAPAKSPQPTFAATQQANQTHWQSFWTTGGAVDLSGSTDSRAKELERRIVLSQYLTKIQCSGTIPPQETGLTYNSWYGKPHLEMHWWHAAHFALWNRPALLERSLGWYKKARPGAADLAQRQGFKGVRWQKMVDQDANESPSPIGPFLIWQQPHFIYFAELSYRNHRDQKTLNAYKDLVFATADFMASYAWLDPQKGKYILGKGMIPAQERFKYASTYNPPFELTYWWWGLTTAQQWRERLGMPRNPDWDKVLAGLSPLPTQDGLYLAAESAPDSYTNPEFMTDHPAVLGAYGYMPKSPSLDVPTMTRTFDKIMTVWNWESTWGWDYPLVAMTAARLGKPDKAIDALLMPVTKNTFLHNGHNYQRDNLRIYLPGNGGLLAAVAMMCAGWDTDSGVTSPGFPKNGKWLVRWENLAKMP